MPETRKGTYMARPVIGIICNKSVLENDYSIHGTGLINVQAIGRVTGALPLLVPCEPEFVQIADLMAACDGFLFTGGRPNVHPEHYGEEPTEAHGAFDLERDEIALSLIRALIERGQPFLGVCRGFQEVNVALGGSLYPEIRDLPGRDNHRMPPEGTLEEKFALRHEVTFSDGGVFHELMGARRVMTNTLHGQGIKEPGKGIVIDGHAPDGTPEAIYVEGAPGFTLSVQWHPEWNADQDAVSRPLFEAFGAAVRDWADGQRTQPILKSA